MRRRLRAEPAAPAHLAAPPGRHGRSALPFLCSAVLLLLAVLAGGAFLLGPGPGAPTDTGLVTVLPPSYWLTVVLLLTGFAVSVWGPRLLRSLAAAHTVGLVVTLYGVGVAFSAYPRGIVPWRHVGIASELAGTGVIDPSIDAYFNWPGFFTLLASYTELAGLEDAHALMKWAPVVVQLVLLPPLLVLMRALTRDERLSWSAIALYYLTNWVDQDYLAPQALGFVLYVCVLALLLTFFRPSQRRPPRYRATRVRSALAGPLRVLHGCGPGQDPEGPLAAPATGRSRVLLLVVLITAAVVSMHQLTPFAFLLGFSALVLAQRTTIRGLPVLTGVLIVSWMAYGAATYMEGNLGQLLSGVGDVAGAAQAGVVERTQGSPGHMVVVKGRIAFSLAVWGLAGLAVALLYRSGRRDTTAVLLCASPALLFPLQSYGGEMPLRIFMFSLPFACFLAVQLLPRAGTPGGRRRAGALFLAGTLLVAPAFVLVRYGNQVIDQRLQGEVRAVTELYRLAPPGALLVAGNENTPWRNTEYGEHRHVVLSRLLEELVPAGASAPADAAEVERVLLDGLAAREDGAFLLLTDQQEEFERLLGRPTSYRLADVRQQLVRSPRFVVVHDGPGAVVLTPAKEQP